MPPTIATSIAYHHLPGAALVHRRLSALVHAGDVMARALGIGHGGDTHPVKLDPAARSLAKHVTAAAADKRDTIVAQVDSIISG